MTENDYKSLCEACDKLLLESDTTVERIAIPWLNVIRPHPIFFKQYVPIFRQKHVLVSVASRGVRYTVKNLRNLFSSVLRSRSLQSSKVPPLKPCDVLFISHLVNVSQAEKEEDNYFGDMPMKLVQAGISVSIGLLNHTDDKRAAMDARWLDRTVPRVVLDMVISVSQEWALLKRVITESVRLSSKLARSSSSLDRKVISFAAVEAFSDSTLFALRIGIQVRNLVECTRASVIIITAEGHSWERVAIHAAREASPNISCISYQHAALFRFQHSLQRRLSPTFDPDIILTSGAVSKRILSENIRDDRQQILKIGSSRWLNTNPSGAKPKNSYDRAICLVLPEGIISECRLLFEFSLRCARARPLLKFIWRLHPSISRRELFRVLPELKNIPHNIVFSTSNLSDDIQSSAWALYRGSTAIVQAVVGGVIPIYLKRADEIIIDPLFELSALRPEVSTPEEFENFITEKTDFSSLKDQLIKYSKDVFTPLDVSVLKEIINYINPGCSSISVSCMKSNISKHL